jgi:hypothetical protein
MQNADLTVNIVASYLANTTIILAEPSQSNSVTTNTQGYFRITSTG